MFEITTRRREEKSTFELTRLLITTMNRKNITSWLNRRETDSHITRRFERQMHVVPSFAERFGLNTELEGHTGCVNCLEWNSTGDLLASGSDDLNAIIWEPLRKRKLCTISTGHTGNIFSVKFLPCTNDEIIATAAADAKVRIHSVEKAETTSVFHCHIGRVKRLAVAPNAPDVLWSASEDGTIRQFDLRQAHSCNSNSNKNCRNVLINLNVHVGAMAEAKCIAINPIRPELLAIGCNDPFVRVYDHRMLSTQNSSLAEQKSANGTTTSLEEARLPEGCVKYFAPGHLPPRLSRDFPRPLRAYVSTYVNFSPDGNEVIANLGGEQIYLFDIRKPISVVGYRQYNGLNGTISSNGVVKDVIDCVSSATCDNNSNVANGTTNGFKIPPVNGKTHLVSKPTNGHTVLNSSSLCKDLPPKALELKALGNEAFCKQQFWTAVNAYNEAISLAPNSAILYANRAAAYIKRAWDGDIYAALRDCHIALGLDPHHTKAHFRKARCLYELRWCQEALYCLDQFKAKFPEQADGTAAKTLEREIKAAAFAETEEPDENSSSDKNKPEGGPSRRRHRRMSVISDQERVFRSHSFDYSLRFCGHCNTTTDIKEANFFGSNGQYIVAGSDDGSFFLWDKETTNLVRVLKGDDSIVNCLQPHPSICLLATSGIDPVIRLWGPRPLDGKAEGRQVEEVEAAARANQKRMNADPLEVMLMNMGYRTRFSTIDDDEGDDNPVQCRTA